MATILVVDDDVTEGEFFKKLLLDASYKVVLADGVDDALKKAKQTPVDVAVLDYKLAQEEDDNSGFYLATQLDRNIQKILISSVATDEIINDHQLKTYEDGSRIIVRFLHKSTIKRNKQVLLDTVFSAYETRKSEQRLTRENLSLVVAKERRYLTIFDVMHSIVHLIAAAAFVILMVIATLQLHDDKIAAVFLVVALLAAEVANFFIARKGHSFSSRADSSHIELLQAKRFEDLLQACGQIDDSSLRDEARKQLVLTTADAWFGENRSIDPALPE